MNAITKEETQLPAVQADATSLLTAITQAASNPNVDIEKMERLFAMHQKMVAQEAEAAFNAAMSRAQARIEPIATNAENVHTRSRYAKLEAINRQIVPIYTAEGLSVSYDTSESPVQGLQRTIAIVSHSQGHSRQYHIDLPADAEGFKGTANKTGVQATGSTNSYARRYLTCMIFNVSTFDDKDGNGRRTEVEPDPEGKKKLEACGSRAAVAKVWNALTIEERKTLVGVKDECLAKIAAADKAAAS